jgi:hypothetical protein
MKTRRQLKELEARHKDRRIPPRERERIWTQLESLKRRRREAARQIVAVPKQERGKVRFRGNLPSVIKMEALEGAELASAYTHADLLPEVEIMYDANRKRAGYRSGVVRLGGTSNVNTNTVLHEITHGTEQQNPAVLAATQDFLARRTVGETPQPLSVLANNPKYRPDEVALEDRWVELGGSVYTGKVYPDGKTEILTMGIGRLHAELMKFLRTDPGHFAFVVKTLRKWKTYLRNVRSISVKASFASSYPAPGARA